MPMYADLKLVDIKTGKVISKQQKAKIGSIPKLTNRFTTIVDGNEYITVNQLRRKSGIYSRVKENGELESEFNLERGFNFKMQLDPVSERFNLILSNRKYRLWTLLNILGMEDKVISEAWGAKLLLKNKEGALNTEVSEMTSIYTKLFKVAPKEFREVINGLQQYFNDYTRVDSETTKLTLGESFEKVNADTLLAASVKLLKINKGLDKPDERDNLIFKKILGVDDLLIEHFKGHQEGLKKKISRSMGFKDSVRDIVSAGLFYKPIKDFFTTGDMTGTPPQTNPVTIIAERRKTTPMGTGGIKNSHAVTMDTRSVQPSHLGFLDPVATPECFDKDSEIFTEQG